MRSGSNMGPGGRGEEVLSGRGLGENQRGPDEWVLGFRQSDVRGSQCGACDVLRTRDLIYGMRALAPHCEYHKAQSCNKQNSLSMFGSALRISGEKTRFRFTD